MFELYSSVYILIIIEKKSFLLYKSLVLFLSIEITQFREIFTFYPSIHPSGNDIWKSHLSPRID